MFSSHLDSVPVLDVLNSPGHINDPQLFVPII